MVGARGAREHPMMTDGIARPTSSPARGVFGRLGRGGALIIGLMIALLVAVGICEALGWPFLAAPAQRWLSSTLQRRVSFSADDAASPRVQIRLLGRIEVRAPYLEIAAPAWSAAPHMLLARDAVLKLRYIDLWRAYRGEALRVRELRAAQLDGQLERLADGRASWQFRDKAAPPNEAAKLPRFDRLEIESGTLAYRDAPMAADVNARFSLTDGAATAPAFSPASAGAGASSAEKAVAGASGSASASGAGASAPAFGLQFNARGSYQKFPLTIDVKTAGALPLIAEDAATTALPVTIDAHVGRAVIKFYGTATDALHFGGLQGRFSVQGPSLAAVGDPLRITLPTTAPFRAEGLIAKQGVVWNAVLERVDIGASRLAGAFRYDPQPATPMLSGRLTGSKLALADLGPAVGGRVKAGAPGAAATAASAAPARVTEPVATKPGRMLPNRDFDLPALRAMNANVLINIDNLDLGTALLEPLKPMRTHLVLTDGVLALRDIDARTGQGQLGGLVQLDGRNRIALWTADLRWSGVRLERWIRQVRANNAPPWATGSLNGRARVAGQGRSTADILGSLRGGVRMQLVKGSVSHLAIEAAGLDVAQSLGVLIKGDDSLPILCTVADLVAEEGVLRPRVFVLDTSDSTLWIDGSLSLASEAMDLRLVVTPKDFSPLAFRAPLHLRGTFADPSVSVDKEKLGMRLGASVLLGLINPLAALIPLLDVGDSADAQRGAQDCRALSARMKVAPPGPAPAPSAKRARAG